MSRLFDLLVLYGLGVIAAVVFLVLVSRGMRRRLEGDGKSED